MIDRRSGGTVALADDTINRQRGDMLNSDQIEEMVPGTVSSFLSPSADNNRGMRLEGQDRI